MLDFINKHKKGLIVILVALILIGTTWFTIGRGNTLGENFLGTVTRPITGFFNGIGNFFGNLGKDPETKVVKEENEKLRRDNIELDELKAENDRLKGLLEYKEKNTVYEYQTAKISARSSNYWFNMFTISSGKSSGIVEGMPVVSSKGLVGKVSEVGATWSKVTSIIDSTSAVSAMVERTRDNGTIKSTLDTSKGSYQLTLEHLPTDSNVQPGDNIITSGLGGTYPKGILIGHVSEVEQQSDGSKIVKIEPVTDFKKLEEIMIIKSRNASDLLG